MAMIGGIKQRSLHRAKILEGQMHGVQKMIENHVRTHIKESLSSSSEKEQEKAVAELLALYDLTNVRSK